MSMRTIVNGFLATIGILVGFIFLAVNNHLKSIDEHLIGRGQQYTEAFHIILLPEGHCGRRRLMNNSSIVRLHREVIVLSGAESCFLNNLAI